MSESVRTFVYHHTHWDREWYEPFSSYQVRLLEVIDAILEGLESGTLPCFTLDGQTVLVADYLLLRPQRAGAIRRFVAESRLSLGPWFVMPDEFLVSGESLIRNLKHGIETAESFGCTRFTGYLPDTFGHSDAIPAVLNGFGIRDAIVWRGVSPDHPPAFDWFGADGSQLLTYVLRQGYFQFDLHDPTLGDAVARDAIAGLRQTLAADSPPAGLVLVPIGGDHLGPLDERGLRLLNEALPDEEPILVDAFMRRLQESWSPGERPRRMGELFDPSPGPNYLLPGVWSSRLYLKQRNRALEHRLTRWLEPLMALTALALPGARRRIAGLEAPLDAAWRQLLLNHPHDSICGCSVDAVHRENESRFDSVDAACEAIEARLIQLLQAAGPTQAELLLINTGNRPAQGVIPVVLEGDGPLPPNFQPETETEALQNDYRLNWRTVPLADRTMSLRTGWIWRDGPVAPLSLETVDTAHLRGGPQYTAGADSEAWRLGNGLLTVEVKPDGTLIVWDHVENRCYPGLHVLLDAPESGDSYNTGPTPGATPERPLLNDVEVGLKGPLVASLYLTYRFPGTDWGLSTEVILQAGSRLVSFITQFTNEYPDHRLQVGFPTGRTVDRVWVESHFGLIERRYPPYEEASRWDALPVSRGHEWLPNTGPIQRFVAANGQLLVTEGLTEYEVTGDRLEITLLRTFGVLSRGDGPTRGAQAGPPLPTPEGQCLDRPTACRYHWQPVDTGDRQAVTEAGYSAAEQAYGVVRGYRGRRPLDAETRLYDRCSLLPGWGGNEAPLWTTSTRWQAEPETPSRGQLIIRLLNPTDATCRWSPPPPGDGWGVCSVQPTDFADRPQGPHSPLSPEHPIVVGAHGIQTLAFQVE